MIIEDPVCPSGWKIYYGQSRVLMHTKDRCVQGAVCGMEYARN